VSQWIAQTQRWADDFNRKFAAAGAMHGVKSSNTGQVMKMRELLAETEQYVTDRDWGVLPKLPGIPEDLQRRISADQRDSTFDLKRNPFKRPPATQPE